MTQRPRSGRSTIDDSSPGSWALTRTGGPRPHSHPRFSYTLSLWTPVISRTGEVTETIDPSGRTD